MYTFVIYNNKQAVKHAETNWKYFLKKREGCHVVIKNNNVYIHISEYYCLIVNDLVRFINHKTYVVTTTKSALKWLNVYNRIDDEKNLSLVKNQTQLSHEEYDKLLKSKIQALNSLIKQQNTIIKQTKEILKDLNSIARG